MGLRLQVLDSEKGSYYDWIAQGVTSYQDNLLASPFCVTRCSVMVHVSDIDLPLSPFVYERHFCQNCHLVHLSIKTFCHIFSNALTNANLLVCLQFLLFRLFFKSLIFLNFGMFS